MSARPKVALVSGFWGQNIGNAFFNIGGKWILEQVFGEGEVDFIQDQPGYWTFNNKMKGNPANNVVLLKYLDVDYIVLQGPCLSAYFEPLWNETLTELTRRGTKLILLGAAFFKYTPEEIRAAKVMIDRFKPVLISTRDSRSYEILKDWVPHTHDGIDSAFFVPKAYTPFKLTKPYITLNFDRFPEPNITLGGQPGEGEGVSFEELGARWRLEIPKTQDWFSHKGKAEAYFGHLIDRRKLPSELLGRMVIRPEHRMNPHLGWKIYSQPNALVADEPWTYFTVYAGTDLTLADRVHACVMTLAYGNPAMLFTPSPRSALFERVGMTEIKQRPLRLEPDYLEEQRQNELAFLKDAVAATAD